MLSPVMAASSLTSAPRSACRSTATPSLLAPSEKRNAGGRPTSYDETQVTEILDRIAGGESVRQICKGVDSRNVRMPAAGTFLSWHINDTPPGISARYRRACEIRAELWADEVVQVAGGREEAEDGTVTIDPDPKSRQVKVEARKWVAQKLLRLYAERQTISIEDPDAVLARTLGVRKEELPEPEAGDAGPAPSNSTSVDVRSREGGEREVAPPPGLDKHQG
jgi:hypothetical protein